MRIILIILSLTALVFVGWLATNIAGKAWDNSLNWTSQNQNSQNFSNDLTIEQLKHQLKTEQELSEIKAQLAQLTGTNTATTTQENTTTTTNSGEIIPVSAKFLGKILPTIELTKTENNGIFDLHTFDNTAYTTYSDEKLEELSRKNQTLKLEETKKEGGEHA